MLDKEFETIGNSKGIGIFVGVVKPITIVLTFGTNNVLY
jgi:hypothetical protein